MCKIKTDKTYIPKVVEFPNFIWKTKRTDGYARWKLKLHGYIFQI